MILNFNFFKKNQKINGEFILGIIFKELKGKLMVFETRDHGILLKTTKEFLYSNGWESLVEDIDQGLTLLEEEGYKDFSSIIYLLNAAFLDQETKEVRKNFLPKLKEIEKKLSLKSIGYIEIDAAVITKIEKENGLPLSAIFLNVEKTYFQFILRKGGKNIFEKRIARSDNFLFDFYEAVSYVKDYIPLPIRIIMFDDKNLEKEKNILINHQFKEEYFIQPPRVEIIESKIVDQYLTEIIEKQLDLNTVVKIKEKRVEESFGFIIGKDIKETNKETVPDFFNREIKKDKKFSNWPQVKKLMSSIFSSLKDLISLFYSKLNLSRLNVIIFGLLTIGLAIFINEYYFHQVKLFITPRKKLFQKQINLSAEEIPLTSKKIERQISKTIATSGSKTVGEKAKGEIYLYNYTFSEKKLNAGIILTANNIKFILDNDIKIASASYIGNQIGNPLEPGKSKTNITATTIGEEGNLPKGSIFQIEGLSQNEVFGKNEIALTGGSKKRVRTFSSQDKEKIRTQLLDQVKNIFNNNDNLNKNLILINDLTEIKFIDENYSHELEEETDKVTLKAKIGIIYYFYDKEKLKDEFFNLLKKEAPKDFQLKKEKINLSLKKISQKNDKKNFEFLVNGYYNKNINYQELQKKLIFFKKNHLKSLLDSYQVEKYSLKEENKIPLFPNNLPFVIKNIVVIEN